MTRLGQPDYYTQERKIQIKKTQIKKILQELLDEKQNLSYLRDIYL